MITWKDLYTVISVVVPLYVTMFFAYGSVKWWKVFSPEQCAGINKFVAVFAVPLLSFEFISRINPYKLNFTFIAADVVSKAMALLVLGLWAKWSHRGSLDWVITLFSLSTLPNTLVMGIPILKAMYGDSAENLMVQTVALQSIHTSSFHEDFDLDGGLLFRDAKSAESIFVVLVKLTWSHDIWNFNM